MSVDNHDEHEELALVGSGGDQLMDGVGVGIGAGPSMSKEERRAA